LRHRAQLIVACCVGCRAVEVACLVDCRVVKVARSIHFRAVKVARSLYCRAIVAISLSSRAVEGTRSVSIHAMRSRDLFQVAPSRARTPFIAAPPSGSRTPLRRPPAASHRCALSFMRHRGAQTLFYLRRCALKLHCAVECSCFIALPCAQPSLAHSF
jgi:hypothetical protein